MRRMNRTKKASVATALYVRRVTHTQILLLSIKVNVFSYCCTTKCKHDFLLLQAKYLAAAFFSVVVC